MTTEEVTALRAAVTARTRDHATAVASLQQAQGYAQGARGELLAEFGVSTVQEAERLAADMEHELDQEAAAVRAALEGAGR
jgi:hypothetical protein